MFPTTRIVVDDGYLNYPPAEGVEVAAHELGHYVRHDPDLGVLVALVWLSVGIGALYFAITGQGHAEIFKSAGLARSSLIPTSVFILTLVYVAGLPVFNLIQRQIEHRADRYAMELTQDGPAGVESMRRDIRCDHLDPSPDWWARTFFWTHPTISERIEFMSGYRPKSTGGN